MSDELQKEVTPKLMKRLHACSEDFLKQLEQLDSLSLGETANTIKNRRKSLVTQIQVYDESFAGFWN